MSHLFRVVGGTSLTGRYTAAHHELAALVAEAGRDEDALYLFEMAALAAIRYPSMEAEVHRDWAASLRRMGRHAEAMRHETRAAALVTDLSEKQP